MITELLFIKLMAKLENKNINLKLGLNTKLFKPFYINSSKKYEALSK